jgi:hypothetical protein
MAQIFICALSLCYGIYFRNYSCELIYYFTYHYISVYINITALTIQYHRGKSTKFLECESSENQEYGRTFYEQVAMDLGYKQRFIHSFQCVYMLKDYPYFKKKDFEYLCGRIQVLIPDNKRKPGKRYKIIRNCIFFPVFIILAKNLCTFEC